MPFFVGPPSPSPPRRVFSIPSPCGKMRSLWFGGTETEPNIFVGLRFTPPNLQEKGEGIVNQYLRHAGKMPFFVGLVERRPNPTSSLGCVSLHPTYKKKAKVFLENTGFAMQGQYRRQVGLVERRPNPTSSLGCVSLHPTYKKKAKVFSM